MNFKADDARFTSQNNILRTRHNGNDDGFTVRTRPCTTAVHTVRQSGSVVAARTEPHSLELIIAIYYIVAMI